MLKNHGGSSIVGKWQKTRGDKETLEFFKDGTVNVVSPMMTIAGKYSFIDDNRLKIELGGIGALAGPVLFHFSISGQQLTLTDSEGKVETYQNTRQHAPFTPVVKPRVIPSKKPAVELGNTDPQTKSISPRHPAREFNTEQKSAPSPRTAQQATSQMPSSPPSAAPNAPEQIVGLRAVPRLIAPPLLECHSPCWSPDGKYVMFVATATEQLAGLKANMSSEPLVVPENIWVISADGSKRWQVSNFFFGNLRAPTGRRADPLKLSVTHVSWSRDGERIAFSAYEGEHRPIGLPTNLYVMKADASDVFQVAEGQGCEVSWTADGKALLLNGSRRGSTIDLEGTKLTPLTGPGGIELTQVHPSLDGKKYVAVGKSAPVTHGICVVDINANHVRWLNKQGDFGGDKTNVWPICWSPDGKEILVESADVVGGERRVLVLDAETGNQRRLVEGDRPAWSPDGKRIVFEGGMGGGKGDIYLIDPDGKNLRRITNLTPPGVQMIWGSHPCWSPNGKQIVFRRGQHIWVANSDGTGQSHVAYSTDHSRDIQVGPFEWTPRWKPDGDIVFTPYKEAKWATFGAKPEFEVTVANVDGTGVRRLLLLQSPADGDDACWSPDGSKMAYDKNGNIWVAKGDGTEERRLTGGRNPRWSPDGEKILYIRGSEHNEVLCTINADGNSQTQITEASQHYRACHSWCPDGKKIAFEGDHGVFVVSVHGDDARRLVWGQQPCWSPDGKRLAFRTMGRLTSDTGAHGPPCIYVMNADGTGMRLVMQVDKTSYGNNLVNNLSWSPDNKHILFEETARMGYEDTVTARMGYYENLHHIWIVDVSEAVFYEASYAAPELLPWKVPQFEFVPHTN